MSEVVTFSKGSNVGLITVNNPPVNALSHAVRQGIKAGLEKGIADSDVAAMALICQGRTFIAGADIREFDKPSEEPFLPDIVQLIEGSPKPVIAAIHGTALGGGLEVALGCHYRIALYSRSETPPPIR